MLLASAYLDLCFQRHWLGLGIPLPFEIAEALADERGDSLLVRVSGQTRLFSPSSDVKVANDVVFSTLPCQRQGTSLLS